MKVSIIGNGVAGIFSAQNIRSLNKDVEIEIFSQEKYPYYSRIKLPELISEKLKIEDLIVFKGEWYEKNEIKTKLGKKINRIHPEHKHIFIEGESDPISYDKLILATGSMPNIPPIKNAHNLLGKGVFTLRNIDNALQIKNYIIENDIKKAIIIGGGLLGLELAKQINNRDLDTTVIEFFPRLLPKQLDLDCGNMLKEVIEEMGIKVIVGAATEQILGDGKVSGIKLKNGRIYDANLVLIQAGIRPSIDIVIQTKIKTSKGIIVNQYLETNLKDIYAVGDCIEYKGYTWGIIPACIEQSKIISATILGKKHVQYRGTIPKNTLKIVGIDLTTIGMFDLEDIEQVGAGWEIIRAADKKGKCYKKIVLKDNKLKGAILFGEKKAVSYVNKNIDLEVDEIELRTALEIFKWKCNSCKNIYDEARRELLFKDLPDGWKCDCGAPKEDFERFPPIKNKII